MRTSASFVLFLMLISVVSAFAFYSFAGTLAQSNFERERMSRAAQVAQARALHAEKIQSIESIQRMIKSAEADRDAPASDDAQRQQKDAFWGKTISARVAILKSYEEQLPQLDRSEREAREQYDDFVRTQPRDPAGGVTTTVARIAIGVLLVFLVQLLSGVYRYSLKMAAFYQGRADAMLVHREVPAISVKDAIDWFAGDKVDFDRPPRAPVDTAARLAETALNAAAEVAKKRRELPGEPETPGA